MSVFCQQSVWCNLDEAMGAAWLGAVWLSECRHMKMELIFSLDCRTWLCHEQQCQRCDTCISELQENDIKDTRLLCTMAKITDQPDACGNDCIGRLLPLQVNDNQDARFACSKAKITGKAPSV